VTEYIVAISDSYILDALAVKFTRGKDEVIIYHICKLPLDVQKVYKFIDSFFEAN